DFPSEIYDAERITACLTLDHRTDACVDVALVIVRVAQLLLGCIPLALVESVGRIVIAASNESRCTLRQGLALARERIELVDLGGRESLVTECLECADLVSRAFAHIERNHC